MLPVEQNLHLWHPKCQIYFQFGGGFQFGRDWHSPLDAMSPTTATPKHSVISKYLGGSQAVTQVSEAMVDMDWIYLHALREYKPEKDTFCLQAEAVAASPGKMRSRLQHSQETSIVQTLVLLQILLWMHVRQKLKSVSIYRAPPSSLPPPNCR